MVYILPSDRFSNDIKKHKSNGHEIKSNIRIIDLTSIYNWYVDNFECHVSKLYSQNNLILFKFIIEYYICVISVNRLLYYTDGFDTRVIKDIVSDIDYEIIGNFVNNNGISIGLHDSKTTELVLISYYKVFDQLTQILTATLREQGIDPTVSGLVTDDNQDIVHLPIKWDSMKTDILEFRGHDVEAYTNLYPYEKSIKLAIASLSPLDMYYMDSGYIDKTIESCLEPVYTQVG